MRYSDLIVPHGVQNKIAIEFMTDNLKNKLLNRGIIVPKEHVSEVECKNEMLEMMERLLTECQANQMTPESNSNITELDNINNLKSQFRNMI